MWSWTLGWLRNDAWSDTLGNGNWLRAWEHRKKRLEGVLDHINKEIAKLKEDKPEE